MKLPELRQAGIDLAFQNTLFDSPEWAELAMTFVEWYCRHHAEVFFEDLTLMYSGLGYAEPKSSRAWGQIKRSATKAGWLGDKPIGSKQRALNGTWAAVWPSLIYFKRAA
jgi:hypothetical protein